MTKELEGKIALITGASRGIGKEIAKKYAEAGAKLILISRNTSSLEEIDDFARRHGTSATIVPLDLEEHEKIDNLGQEIAKRFSSVDIFVGNAAILGGLSPIAHTCNKTWNKVFNINLTANFRLLKTLDPLLRNSQVGAKVIFVSSSVARSHPAYWGPYAVSKAALESMAMIYAKEVKVNGIDVFLVDPGRVATKMLEEAMPGLDMSNIAKPGEISDVFLKIAIENNTHNTSEMIKCYSDYN